jgi:hypothetical protein
MPVQLIDEPAEAPKAEQNPLPEVAAAMALAQARQTQVLNYSRTKSKESPLTLNLRTDGPTMEQWTKAGYSPDAYPPAGYAELASPMLDEYKALKATLSGQAKPHSVNDVPEVT